MKKTIRSKIMDFVENFGPIRRTDIVKYLRVFIQGKDFDPKRDRGYYSEHFRDRSVEWGGWISGIGPQPVQRNTGYLRHPAKNDPRYLEKQKDGKYAVTK